MHTGRGSKYSAAEHAKVLGPDAAAAPPTVATFQLGSLLPGLVRRRCYESRRESKVTRRGYANSGRTRQWHHHRACGGRVNVRRLLPLLLLLMASILRSLHHTCAGGVEPACTDAPDGAPPPRGTQRRTRHRRMTTVSSTSSFCRRRRRRRLLGRQAAGRGATFGAGCAARRAASAPSPPHPLHSTRAHSAPSVGRTVGRCTGTRWPDLGVRAQLLRSARVKARGERAARAGRWQVERWLGAAPSSDAPGAGRSGAEARGTQEHQKKR